MVKYNIFVILLISLFTCMTNLYAQLNIGADMVSRYVWRGTDFGNSASIQPTLSFAHNGFEIGAWGSYALTAAGAGANENDLYASYSSGPISFTFTDYYFPEAFDFFNYSDKDGFHILELSGGLTAGKFNIMAAVNVSGDPDNSVYAEVAYTAYEFDDISVGLVAGLGNNVYITDTGGDFNFVNLGLTASKGPIFTSFILNPEAETNFLVFGYSISR
jgi:hypothetical protein